MEGRAERKKKRFRTKNKKSPTTGTEIDSSGDQIKEVSKEKGTEKGKPGGVPQKKKEEARRLQTDSRQKRGLKTTN